MKFKMTRKILTVLVQRLLHLVSLDISGHIMLDNCTVPHFEEAVGRPRWVLVPVLTRFRSGSPRLTPVCLLQHRAV